jgi:putative ABC transport system permease protein
MLTNYFKTTFRNLWKNRAYSFLNIAGLAIGIACAALIFLWVENEVTYNHNFEKRNYLYKVYENQTHDNVSTFLATSGPMANALKAEIPGIKNAARLSFNKQLMQLFSLADKTINEQGYYADSSIFSMLTLPFVYGSAANAFKQLHSLVISKSMSEKFFGNKNPVGKTLKVNNEQEYIVTGVFKDLPQNSTFQFQWLAPFEIFEAKNSWLSGWGNNGVTTLVELEPSANIVSINRKLKEFLNTKDDGNNTECFLYSMNRWNLYNHFTNGKEDNDGEIKYVRLFSLIAWIILIIACINFMNLATARSEQRAKEVGVRKVMGAGKTKLISQFISESLLMSFIAVLLAVGFIYISLPSFNSLVEKELSLNLFNPFHIGCLIAIGLVTGLIAGSYPAFYLSSFNPITIFKGMKLKSSGSTGFIRKGLVVSQFTISIALIISTIIIYQQIQHVKNRDLGYNKNNSIYLDLQGQLHDNFNSIYDDLMQTGVVQNAALSEYPSFSIWNNTDNFSWQGKDPKQSILITFENVTPQFLSTMGMKLTIGRDFYTTPKVDSNNILINETLAKRMGKEGKVGGIISAWGQNYNVVGIVKDFVYNNMYGKSDPFLAFCNPANVTNGCLTIRFKQNADIANALAKTETIIKRNNPDYPFEYKFVDEEFDKLFKTETLIGKLAGVFAMLAIFISCLGLFGLAAYTAEKRTKEIGIRKVLGASATGLAKLLSKDFLQLVAIACVIAFPMAWWAMHNWLQNYEYRTQLYWWVFASAGIAALIIALLTVSFQAIKAAMANPVKSLRTE